jgi:glycosyltransferase involved in cell wall biosynthesis
MSTPPRVTIVVPCFNHGRYLGEALQSVVDQDYEDFEAIVVDDGSTDKTPEVVNSFADPRIKYVSQENQGLSAARNTGIRNSSGELIAFLDADDTYHPAFLSTLLKLLAGDMKARAAYCGYQFIDECGRPLPRKECRVVAPKSFFSAMLDGGFLVPACFLLYRNCLDRVGLFDPGLSGCADWDMWLRISEVFRVIGSSRSLVKYRVISNSMSSDAAQMAAEKLAVLEKRRTAGQTASMRVDRAFAYAHLQNAVAFLHSGQHEEARRSLHRMVEVYPEILRDESVFYELGCAHQLRGYRGHFASLNLPQAITTVEWTLRELIRGLAEDYVRAGISRAHLAVAKLAYGTGDSIKARRRFVRALAFDPHLLLRPGFFTMSAKSLLPRGLLCLLRQSKRPTTWHSSGNEAGR